MFTAPTAIRIIRAEVSLRGHSLSRHCSSVFTPYCIESRPVRQSDSGPLNFLLCNMRYVWKRGRSWKGCYTYSLIRVKVDGVKCFLEKGFHGSSLRAVTGPIPAIPDPSPSLWNSSEPYCGKGFALQFNNWIVISGINTIFFLICFGLFPTGPKLWIN